MKQLGQSLQGGNLQEFLDSAANATDLGPCQFFTPTALAAVLFRPLSIHCRELLMDLHFGSGSLAVAAGAKHALGLDIDPRVCNQLTPPDNARWDVGVADLTHWYPIAAEADFKAPFIVLNPPFSLRWHASRLAALRESDIEAVAETIAGYPETIDSTLASFLIALDRLRYLGEGFMICNAATARRFFGDPSARSASGKHPDLAEYIWQWLEIPGLPFDGLSQPLDTAVLYFSRSYGDYASPGQRPRYIRSSAAHPDSVLLALLENGGLDGFSGSRIRNDFEVRPKDTLPTFVAVNEEYSVRHHQAKPRFNIQLDGQGRLHTFLTPFQQVSQKLDRNLVARLNALNGQTPISLCVTATSRTVLREAVECGVWTVHPHVTAAINAALAEYDRDGAPFYRPNETQALGWIDEHGALTCRKNGIGSCQKGQRYTIATSIEATVWEDGRINLAGDPESVEFTGKELLVKILDADGCEHHFHVRRDDAKAEPQLDAAGQVTVVHWHIEDLKEHFTIPIPDDLATLHPERYQGNLDRLAELEKRINSNLAAIG